MKLKINFLYNEHSSGAQQTPVTSGYHLENTNLELYLKIEGKPSHK